MIPSVLDFTFISLGACFWYAHHNAKHPNHYALSYPSKLDPKEFENDNLEGSPPKEASAIVEGEERYQSGPRPSLVLAGMLMSILVVLDQTIVS